MRWVDGELTNAYITEVFLDKKNIKTKVESEACRENVRRGRIVSSYVGEELELDSIADQVRQQYLSFPYPFVSVDDIQLEKNYYNGPYRNIPLATYNFASLENVNHFLYKGGNSFS